jgi:hypothetical protein
MRDSRPLPIALLVVMVLSGASPALAAPEGTPSEDLKLK